MAAKMGPLRRVKLTELNAHLVCVLCSGYFVDATTIIECLHTFCKTCIVRYLQTSSFCPICDVQVHKTKPLLSLREDKTLQDVVFKLVPDLFHSEMNRRSHFYKEHPGAGGDKTEQSLRERRHFFHVDDQISLSLEYLPSAPTNTTYSHLHGLKPLKIINGQQEKGKAVNDDKDFSGGKKEEGKMDEETEDDKLPAKVIHKRYLKCPAAVQISHLEKFIRLKYSLTSQTHRVDIMHGGDCLVGELTLLDVVYMYKWTEDAPLRLMYTVSSIPQTRKRARPNGLRTSTATDSDAPAAKVPKTSQPSLLQQQSAYQLTHSQVHPVSGRDQDALDSNDVELSKESSCSVNEKIVSDNQITSIGISTISTTNATCTSSIGIVSSHMALNIPSLPSTILNSGIARLSNTLPSGRRPAYTKTTPANATPRLAVPTNSYNTTENMCTVPALEGVAVTVQMTKPASTITTAVGVTFTNATTTTTIVNSNFVSVPPLVTGVSRPTINGIAESCENINNNNMGQQILQPIIPTKPRLGRPPNASRVAAMKNPNPRQTGDIRTIRPGVPGNVNKVAVNKEPLATSSLNVQSKLSNTNGPKLGNPIVAIKRLNEVPKLAGSSDPSKKLAVSNKGGNTTDTQVPKSNTTISQPQQSTCDTALSQTKPVAAVNATILANESANKNSQNSHPSTKLVTSIQGQKPRMSIPQQTVNPVPKVKQLPTTQLHLQGNSIAKPQTPVVSVTPNISSQVSVSHSEQMAGNIQVPGNSVKSSLPSQVTVKHSVSTTPVWDSHSETTGSNNKLSGNSVKSSLGSQTTWSSQASVSSPPVSVPQTCVSDFSVLNFQSIISSSSSSPTVSISSQLSTSAINPTLSVQPKIRPTVSRTTTPSPVRTQTPTTVPMKTSAATGSQRSPASTPSRMPMGPAQRGHSSPSLNCMPSNAAPLRAVSNNSFRPSSPAPHRVSASPASLRTCPSPAPHRAPPSPAPHRAPPSPAPHRSSPNPTPHRAPPSPAPHRAPPSPAPHRAPPSPAPHRAPPSPAPHRAPPSPAPHRAPPSPAPHRAPPSPAPHRAPPSPASQASPSPVTQVSTSSLKQPSSPATSQAPASPVNLPQNSVSINIPQSSAPSNITSQNSTSAVHPSTSVGQQGKTKSSLQPSKANSQGKLQLTSKQSTISTASTSVSAEGKKSTMSNTATKQSSVSTPPTTVVAEGKRTSLNIASKEMSSVSTNGSVTNRGTPVNPGGRTIGSMKHGANKAVNTNTVVSSSESKLTNHSDAKIATSDAKAAVKISPSAKATPKSPGRKKGSASNSTILSIAQNLANRQLHQQRTVNTTTLSNSVTTTNTNVTPQAQTTVQQPYSTTTQNAIVYPSSGLVSPALAAYMATAYGGDAMRNLITLSQTAACLREFNLAMVQAAETQAKTNEPAPIDLSPTSKAAPQTPLTNGRNNTISTTSPILGSSTKSKSVNQVKASTSTDNSAPTISPPTPEVTITKLPNTPATSGVTTPTTQSGKNVPGLVKLTSSSTNTVSITKRPVSANRIAVAKSPANASVRQIPNPSLLRHQSEARNNNNVNKTVTTTASIKGNSTSASKPQQSQNASKTQQPQNASKTQQAQKSNSSGRSVGNSPLKDTGPLPETSSILKIENLTRSLAPPPTAAAGAATASPSFRYFDNR